MKRNNIIIASAISALPLVVWGVKAVIKKDPLQKIKDALMKQDLYRKDDLKSSNPLEHEETDEVQVGKEINEIVHEEELAGNEEIADKIAFPLMNEDVTSVRKKSVANEIRKAREVFKDKVVAKTPDGQDIYEGAKGGRYTISANGKKFYIKK